MIGIQDYPASAVPMKVEVRRLPDSVSGATRFLNPDHVVALPAAGNVSGKTPLLIFLHGSGERGSDLIKLKADPPIRFFNQQDEHPFLIVVPQCAPD